MDFNIKFIINDFNFDNRYKEVTWLHSGGDFETTKSKSVTVIREV